MKFSFLPDALGTLGLSLIGAGLYRFLPALSIIYAGLVLVLLARLLARSEPPAASLAAEEE